MISLTEAEQFEYPEQEIDKPLKHITLSEADSIESYKFKPFEYERGAVTKFATGVVDTIRDMQDLPEQLSIFGNRLSYGYGGYFGDTEEETERKKQNLLTAERNLEASQRERYRFTSGKEQESIAYGVGSGVVSYGTMLISSGLAGGVAKAVGMGAKAVGAAAEVGGLGAMGVMELAGQVQDKTPTKDGQIDAEAMTPEWARRVTNGTVIYTALSGLTEKYVGFGRQLKMWEKPISWGNSFTSNILTGIKSGVKSGLSEGLTEGIQDLEATGIGLLDGSVRLADLPARIQQAWKSAIIGGIIGTSAGTAVAIKSGRNVRKQLRDMVYPVVGNMDEAQSIADAIYQSGTDEMTKVMSIELELSSELKNKHGKVWNSMLAAVDKAVAASGSARFKNMTEEERAEYVNTAAKSFADQVLAEAHNRGTTIDALIKDTDIVYDKGLRIKRNINVYDALKNPEMIPPETKLKRTSLIQYLRSRGGVQDVGGDLKSRGAIKEAPGLISKKGMGLDDATLSAWEQGYFPEFVERPTINDLLNAIDDELRGKKRYNVEEEATFEDELADLAEGLDRMGIDWRNMQPAEIEQAVEEYPELQRLEKELQFYDEFEYDVTTNVTGMSEEELEAYDERLGMQLYQTEEDGEVKVATGDEAVLNEQRAKNEEYNKVAVSHFGTTFRLSEAGYILTDGRLLDFSGKKFGAQGGSRTLDHREVSDAFEDYNVSMEDFINSGNIRYMPEGDKILLSNVPTPAQYKVIERIVNNSGGNITIELMGDANRWGMNRNDFYNDYEDASFNSIKRDINAFYKGEGVRQITQYWQTEEEKDLYATHNMNLVGVRNALKLGGLAMPSLAMRKVSQGNINQFGDIVFVANERLAAPARGIEVYDRDAWTPNLSYAVRYDLNSSGTDYIRKVLDRVGQSISYSNYRYNIEENIMSPQSNTMAVELYALDKGIEDTYGLQSSQEYLDWYDEHILSNAEPYLWTENASNTDMVKKKFTLDNMMKILRKQEKSGGGFIGDYIFDVFKLLNFRAQKFKNLKEIKKSKHKLVSPEEQREALNKLNDDFLALAEELKKEGEDYRFGDATYGLGVALIQESDERIKYFLDMKNLQSDDAAMKKVKDFIERMKNVPTDYFEVKPRRTVEFSEFSGVIIPKGKQYDDVANVLERQHYLTVERVEKGNEGEYEQALRNIQANSSTAFFQKAKGVTRVTPDEYIIKLLEGADESTLAHELAHYWLDTMFNYVRSGRASESYMNRWNAIADYLKIDPNQTTLTRPQQEKFASSYEAYLTRGQLPSAPIQSAFDDYDKWLQRVYNDYNQITYAAGKTAKSSKRKKVRLTDTAIKFFQSMTTGTLDAPMLAPKDTGVRVEDLRASMPTDMAAAPATVVDTTRVVNITEGEKGVSAVFKREGMKNADRIVDELGVSYNKINLEEQAIKATEWVRNNLEEARKVVDGAAAPEGIIDTAIFIAYENEMLRIGNNAEYTRALKIHSQVQSQRGQAIAAERIATNNMTTPAYWLEKVINNREQRVAERLFKGDVKKLRNLITDETKKAAKEVLGKSQAEQAEYLNKLAEKLRKEYSIDTFYQTPEEEITKDNAMNVIHNFLEDAFGITVSQEEADTLINKAEQLKKVFENTLDESGNPSVESFRILSEMNRTVESMSPSHIMTVMSSIYGRSAMLASIKSPVLNILSNAENFATEGTIRRFTIGADTSVDRKAIEDYMRYAWEVYKSSGFIVSGMQDIKDEIVTLGETRPTTQGKGRLRKIAQTSENIVFKYLMGAPDSVAKDMNFVDTADLLATKIAKEEGAQDISKRATEIFKDAILINPLTEQGKQVREQAIEQAHTATFTNNSMISEFSLKARQWLNMIGGNKFKLGDVVMPFVKTPANVQMMGLEYGFGSLYTLYKVNEIIKNPRSEVSKRAIKSAYRNGLGLLLATLIASMFEPDDYIPEFDNATQKDRDLAKAKNAPFNSIKIGNKWVSLDYFGILGIPLVGIMNARKGRNLIEGITGYVKSGIAQGMKIPGIKEGLAIWDSLSRTAAYSTTPKKAFEMVSNALLDQVRARTIPAIVNDVAKVMDKYERDTSGSVLDKVQASIPFLRERLPERYTISGKPLETEGLSVLLFGGRVKTAEEGQLVSEIDKLAKKQEQPSISDVTKYGDLRLLSPEKKIKVRKEFFREYSKEARKVINSSGYRAKSAEDRKKALNKVRKSVVAELKEKYAKDIKREKRRR